MEVCGEHGAEIAYANDRYNSSCPACDQIEQLEKDHKITVDDMEQQLNESDERIGELEQQLEEKK
jgi:TolA-binding protein